MTKPKTHLSGNSYCQGLAIAACGAHVEQDLVVFDVALWRDVRITCEPCMHTQEYKDVLWRGYVTGNLVWKVA